MTKATGPTRLIWNAQGLPDAKLTGNYWDDLPTCEQCGEPVDGPGTELADGTMIGPCCDRYDEDAAQDATASAASDREAAAQ